MKKEFNYVEDRELWSFEKQAQKHGYKKVSDCHWAQVFEDADGNQIITNREDISNIEDAFKMSAAEYAEEKLSERGAALVNYLLAEGNDVTTDEIDEIDDVDSTDEYQTVYGDYLVLTEDEADELAAERIREDLWAFNASYILKFTKFYETSTDSEDEAFIRAVRCMQEQMSESCNEVIGALIEDLDSFISDTLDADGRGAFLSWYDGNENESGAYYIYRTN